MAAKMYDTYGGPDSPPSPLSAPGTEKITVHSGDPANLAMVNTDLLNALGEPTSRPDSDTSKPPPPPGVPAPHDVSTAGKGPGAISATAGFPIRVYMGAVAGYKR